MKHTFAILTSLVALSISATAEDKKPDAPAPTPAPAAGEKPKMDPEAAFKKMDTNSDASVSLDEWKATKQSQKDLVKAEAVYKKKDKDADGKLTLEEFKAHAPGKGKGDGKKGEDKK